MPTCLSETTARAYGAAARRGQWQTAHPRGAECPCGSFTPPPALRLEQHQAAMARCRIVLLVFRWSGRRGSNPRHSAWEDLAAAPDSSQEEQDASRQVYDQSRDLTLVSALPVSITLGSEGVELDDSLFNTRRKPSLSTAVLHKTFKRRSRATRLSEHFLHRARTYGNRAIGITIKERIKSSTV
jgi:hypothetical protein